MLNPWMIPHLKKKSIEAKINYFHSMKRNIISREENKLFRNPVNALFKKRKILYFENLFLSFRQNINKNLGTD